MFYIGLSFRIFSSWTLNLVTFIFYDDYEWVYKRFIYGDGKFFFIENLLFPGVCSPGFSLFWVYSMTLDYDLLARTRAEVNSPWLAMIFFCIITGVFIYFSFEVCNYISESLLDFCNFAIIRPSWMIYSLICFEGVMVSLLFRGCKKLFDLG